MYLSIGGVNAIAASCGQSNKAACAVGALTTVIGGVAGAAAGAAAYFYSNWKRDENGVYHIYTNGTVPDMVGHSKFDLRTIANGTSIRLDVHGTHETHSILYSWSHERQAHQGFAPFNGVFDTELEKRETIGINTGYASEFYIDYAQSVGEYGLNSISEDQTIANDAYNWMAGPNFDGCCIAFTDGINNGCNDYITTQMAGMKVQPANSGNYRGINNECRDTAIPDVVTAVCPI